MSAEKEADAMDGFSPIHGCGVRGSSGSGGGGWSDFWKILLFLFVVSQLFLIFSGCYWIQGGLDVDSTQKAVSMVIQRDKADD